MKVLSIWYVRKIIRKTNIFTPWYARYVSFSENYVYVLNR